MGTSIKRRQFIGQTGAILAAAAAPYPLLGAKPDKIKIGQIGTKHAHASGKLDSILKHDDVFECVGVVEPDDARWKAVSPKPPYAGLPRLTEEQLFNTQGLQAVAVETEVRQLVPTALRCLHAGMHLHLDKPAGESMSDCRALHALADSKGLTIQMGYMLRYNPAFELLFQALKEGWLGTITEVSGMMGKRASDGLRDELADYPGGGMFELACHIIDALITVLGQPTSITPFTHRTYAERDTFADNQMAVFDYPKALATIRCNHLDPFGGPRRQFNVTGELGTFEIRPLEPPKVRLALTKAAGGFKKGYQDVEMPRMTGRYDKEFQDLARIVRGEKKLAWDSTHDLITHEAVLRASGMKVE